MDRQRELRLVPGQIGGDGLGNIKAVDDQRVSVHTRRQVSRLQALDREKHVAGVSLRQGEGKSHQTRPQIKLRFQHPTRDVETRDDRSAHDPEKQCQ